MDDLEARIAALQADVFACEGVCSGSQYRDFMTRLWALGRTARTHPEYGTLYSARLARIGSDLAAIQLAFGDDE